LVLHLSFHQCSHSTPVLHLPITNYVGEYFTSSMYGLLWQLVEVWQDKTALSIFSCTHARTRTSARTPIHPLRLNCHNALYDYRNDFVYCASELELELLL